jgi:glycosyltransferase involved in cell wall biosynthesis
VDDRPAVTVVVPTHNRRRLLLRTLDSVLHQSDVRLEVVVVDDGGTDGTTEALHALRCADLRVIRNERSQGVSAARNVGLAAVRTPWVAFVDDDDLWAPDKLAAQFTALAAHPDARWSCVSAVRVDSTLQVISPWRAPASGDVSQLLLTRNVIPGGGSGVLADADLARQVGGFDERISILADWDFYLRLSLRSPVASVEPPLVAYYVHSDSMFHDPAGLLRELLYLERRHRDLVDGRSFRFDRAVWFVLLARVAHRLGDHGGAVKYLLEGARQGAAAPMARKLLPRVRRRVRRALRPNTEVELPWHRARQEFAELAHPWLVRYSGTSVPWDEQLPGRNEQP